MPALTTLASFQSPFDRPWSVLDRSMTKPGTDADGVAETEADHFMKYPGCGEWF
jgi:hypothetical protein